jgi:hypothetical protein
MIVDHGEEIKSQGYLHGILGTLCRSAMIVSNWDLTGKEIYMNTTSQP